MSSNTSAKSSNFDSYAFVRELAAKLHQSPDKTAVSIAIEATDADTLLESLTAGITVRDCHVEFESIAVRNQLAAEFYLNTNKEQLGLAADPRWLQLSHNIWNRHDISSKDSPAGRLLAMLYSHFDIFSLAASTITQDNVFDILSVIAAALPHLSNIPVDQLYLLCGAQHDLTRNDYFRGYFFQKLSAALSDRLDVAQQIITRQRQDISEETGSLYMAASSAVACASPSDSAAQILQDAKSESRILRSAAVQMIGALIHQEGLSVTTNEELTDVVRQCLKDSDDLIRESAFVAINRSAGRTNDFDSDLQTMINNGDNGAAFTLAQMLSNHWKEPSRRSLTEDTLPILCRIFSISKLDSRFLDAVLSDMFCEAAHHRVILDSLEQWILAQQQNSQHVRDFVLDLDGITSKIFGSPEFLCNLISTWLIHDDLRLPMTAGKLLGRFFHTDHSRKFKLSFEPIMDALDFATFELLAYRTLAFVTEAESQISLITSLLNTSNRTTLHLKVLRQILTDDLGYEYPGLVITSLEEIISHPVPSNVSDLCKQVTAELRRILETRRSLPHRNELQPPDSLVRSFAKKRTADMYAAFKQSESRSPLLKLVTKIPIKAGRQLFNFEQLPLDRNCQMKTIEVAYTVPRSLILDPVGLEYKRRIYMNLRKNSQ